MIDLVKMKALVWEDEELGANWDEVEIPDELAEQADGVPPGCSIDVLSETDDVILEKFVGEEEITEDDLRKALRDAHHRQRRSCPCSTAPPSRTRVCSPCSTPSSTTCRRRSTSRRSRASTPTGTETLERAPADDAPFAALAFKIVADPHGKLTYFRVYSGTLPKGDQVYNTRTGKKERVGRLLEMHANHREDKDAVFAGDIVAGIGLKDTRTGDTLCDADAPIVLEELEFPEPVIHVAVEPKTKADQDKLGKALYSLSEEDPTFQVRTDDETGQTIISGMGELHLEILVDRMLREFNVDATVGKPQVAYRETITQDVIKCEYRHVKQTGGSGQYAHVIINLEPTGPGGGYEFVDKITGGRIPKEYIPAVDQGIQSSLSAGVVAGYPLVDLRVTLTDGTFHDVDSSEMAFKIAGSMVLKEATRRAKPVLLEPIMSVEVVTPDDYLGEVMGDLSSRRGKLGGSTQRGNSQVIDAQVPLSDMFGYATDLRSRTQGRATYTMQFDSYQQMPKSVQEEIVARVRGE